MSSTIDLVESFSKCHQIRQIELKQMHKLFPLIVEQLTRSSNTNSDHTFFNQDLADEWKQLQVAHDWIDRMINYNVPFGKLIRGLILVTSYRILSTESDQVKNGDNNKLVLKLDDYPAHLLGWCVEMFQATFLITDDMMDNSITRRGQPCWYRNVSFACTQHTENNNNNRTQNSKSLNLRNKKILTPQA